MTTELNATDTFPDIEELMKLQQNTKTMIVFCDHFLSCIVGKVEWKHQVTHKQIKEFANIMDEAFALLVLENIWDDWINVVTTDYFLPKQKDKEENTQSNKHTKTGGGCWTSNSQGAIWFGGLNTDGVQRFNELCAVVVTDCKNNGKFDTDYLSMMTTQTNNNNKIANAVVADELNSEIIQV